MAPSVRVSSESLLAATARAERLLRGSDMRENTHGADEIKMLEVPAAEENLTFDPATLARYCAAAGEIMHAAQSGSDQRARTYLISALRHANNAQAIDLSARIAYRLALIVGQSSANSNTRTARRAARAAMVERAQRPNVVVQMDSACAMILNAAFDDEPSWDATQYSLGCAASQSRKIGDHQVGALAQLQIARSTLAEAERRPQASENLRATAALAALAGMHEAEAIASHTLRRELLARLLEAGLEAGLGNRQETAHGLALLREATDDEPGQLAALHALEGRRLAAMGQQEDAIAALRRAIFFESQRNQPLRLADWYLWLANVEPSQRAAHVLEAYRALESVRPLLPQADPITEESNFSLRMQPVFRAAVDEQLKEATVGRESENIRIAQQIVENFRQAEIQSTLGSDCVPAREPIKPDELTKGELILYPILLDDRVELLLAQAGSNQYQRLVPSTKADRSRVSVLVREMAFSIGYSTDEHWRECARELYSILIGPIQHLLSPDTTLVIVPDGVLRMLPFAALQDNGGKFLVEHTQLVIAPALAYAQPGERMKRSPDIVAASLEESVDLQAGFFPALAGTSAEAKAAAGDHAIGHKGVFLENFRRQDIENAFSGGVVDVLHLATHAAFNGRSDRSFIVTKDGPLLLSELRALIATNQSRGEELSLIVLSACETAVGDDQASMGLAGTAVQAGAQSAVASLWQVDDAGTAELMRQFYDNMRKGQGKAQALRNAQLTLVGNKEGLDDPRIWAAFTLLGGWR